eukprot:1387520-Amorphochlora_amoeboformis.AAC.2
MSRDHTPTSQYSRRNMADLIAAAGDGDVEDVKKLLESKADVNATDERGVESGYSKAEMSCQNGHLEGNIQGCVFASGGGNGVTSCGGPGVRFNRLDAVGGIYVP